MKDVTIKADGLNTRKVAIQAAIGAIIGGGSAALLLFAGRDLLGDMGASRIILAGVGFIYILIGAMVGFGAMAPTAGAKLLNVEDADELRDQRGTLSLSLLVMLVLGGSLMVVALAQAPGRPGGLIDPVWAFAMLVAAIAGVSLLGWLADARYDELDRQLSLEGTAYGFGFSLLVLVPWGAAAHLGLGIRLSPIDMISTLAAMFLFGIFWAVGRRGMMVR